MLDYDLTRAEQVRRTDLAQKARRMILSHMKVEAEDETSLTLDHRGYYMQISFSPLHPLLVVCLAKAIRNPDGARKQQLANELNLHSVLGSHAINEDVKKALSAFLSLLMCMMTLLSISTPVFAATTVDAYMVDFPRDGDSNYSATAWGHSATSLMGGWRFLNSKYTTVHSIGTQL